jgi:hypothetical protein
MLSVGQSIDNLFKVKEIPEDSVILITPEGDEYTLVI